VEFSTVFQQCVSHFHTKKYVRPACIQSFREYAFLHRKRDLPEGERRRGPSREPATELAKHSGNWKLTDGTEKALATNVTAEKYRKCGLRGLQAPNNSDWQLVVIWSPNQIFEIGKRGRDSERELALSLYMLSILDRNPHLVFLSVLRVGGCA